MTQLLDYIIKNEKAFQSKARLQSLYSDFRTQRISNPDGYAANVLAWQTALTNAVRAGFGHESSQSHQHEQDYHHEDQHYHDVKQQRQKSCSSDLLVLRTGDDLVRALETRACGRPLGLGAVVRDAVATKRFMPLKGFLTAKESIYEHKWTVSPWQVLSWGLRQLGLLPLSTADEKLPAESFVIMANLEAAADAFQRRISHLSRPTDLVFSHDDFSRIFSDVLNAPSELSPTDMSILITHLSRDRQALIYDDKTIKLATPTSSAPPEPITHQDTTVASLRSLIKSLQSRTAALNESITKSDSAARAALTRKSRPAALSALRSKKAAENRLATTIDALSRLEEMYAKIEMAADQVEMVRAMESSAQVLKGLHAEVGGVEGVERVVDRLAEEMETADDVQIVVTGAGAGDVDEAEVDGEFERLEEEQRARESEMKMEKDKEEGWEKEEAGDRREKGSENRNVSEANGKSELKGVEKTRERLKELDIIEAAATAVAARKKQEKDTVDDSKQPDKHLAEPEKATELSAAT